ARVVDRVLRGGAPRPELRRRTESGEVEIEETPVPEQPVIRALPSLASGGDRQRLRIFPYAVSRGKLQRAIRDLRIPARLVDLLAEADLILTVKSQERRQPKRLMDAQLRGVRFEVIKSNTLKQMESFLRREFKMGEFPEAQELALREVEEAIDEALDHGHPVELSPQEAYIRRLQHEVVTEAGLVSESKGDEPFRRLVVFPG
ncbi:MAG: single-stranded DNA-binding protein, partial [Acidobacteria bacterium]|nr:single-stranded DNA-binding protein [Acidobacteriota bacterium]